MRIQLASIHDSPNHLRDVAKDDAFYELVDSLREQGLLQPIKVRPNETEYELIYGHRRVAAMRHLDWLDCEAIVEDVDDDEALLQAVAENLQRKDMTVLEEANIYKALRDKNHTTAQIAKMVNKSPSHINTRLNLLQLPDNVQSMVKSGHTQSAPTAEVGAISIDTASQISRTASSSAEATKIARKAVEERLTGMEVRKLTAQLKQVQRPETRQEIIEKPFLPISPITPAVILPEPQSPPQSKTFHTANRSIGEQLHSKWVWNLTRMDLQQYAHFTIGYSQRNWEQVAEILELAEVTILVDARRNAVSQYKPEFSKTNLQLVAEKAGIGYWHISELGIGAEDREDLSETHDYDNLFTTYDRRVDADLLEEMLHNKLRDERLAFMCVELDPETCHRHRIAILLEEMGYSTLDL